MASTITSSSTPTKPNSTSTTTDLPKTMRAWTYTTCPTTLESALTLTSTAPLPPLPLAPGTYLIRVHSASLNPVDYKLPELPLVGRLAIPKPATPGLDFSGTIVLSTPSSRLQPGTLVFGKLEPKQQFGTLAEYVVGSSEGTVEVPEGMGMEEASALGVCGLVTYQALRANVREGMRVLVNGGSGGTGTFAVQIAKALGAEVVVTCSGEFFGGYGLRRGKGSRVETGRTSMLTTKTGANAQLCRDLGADQVIDYRTSNVTSVLEKGERKIDFILDNVGEPAELYWQAPSFTNSSAKYIQVGSQVSLGFIYDLAFRFLVPTWLGGGQRPFSFAFASTSYEDYMGLRGLVGEGKVRAVVDEVFAFEGVREAYAKLRGGRARGKIVVRVAEKS